MKRNRNIRLIVLLSCFLILAGCTRIDGLKVKYGFKNLDFEFLNDENLSTIIIQSTRDKGFRFVVTDKSTIKELYASLSSAKESEVRTDFDSDYIFEFQFLDGETVYYNYVAGVSDLGKGNFYNDETNYIVTDRIDNNLIRNLYSLRKPKYFEDIYYNSLLDLVKTVKKEYPDQEIGVKFYDDVDILRYQLSTDIEKFRANALSEGAVLLSSGEKSDIVLEVKTQGYTTVVYKAIATLKVDSVYVNKKYYIYAKYDNDIKGWETLITDTKPEGF
ncbi:MAG: hypothetical protein WBI17_06675 [Clostridiaceae bacterium]